MHFNTQCDTIFLGESMLLETFGSRIKLLREKKGISQVELSKKTGVVREQISRIENGQINATIKTIHKLTNALDVPLKEVFDFDTRNEENLKNYKIKPFVKWAGGKTQLLEKIRELMPADFNVYYEPFLGGGAVLFDVQPKKAIVSDFNAELMNAYETFKDKKKFNLMIEEIISHENNHSEEYYYEIREMDRKGNYDSYPEYVKAARLIYLNKACFNGLYRVNSKGYFNVPSGKKKTVKAYDKELFDSLHMFLSNSNIVLLQGDFEKTVETATKGDFVYFDPPYDTFNNKNGFTTYTKDAFGKEEQARLAKTYKNLTEKGVYVMLSNHNTDYIRELYAEFNIYVVNARRMINADSSGRGFVEEVIITNY